MAKGTDSSASGGAYVGIPVVRPHATTEGAPKDQGRAVYKVTIPTAGTWRFFARTKWYDGCGNSFYLKIGDKPTITLRVQNMEQHDEEMANELASLVRETVKHTPVLIGTYQAK